MLTYLLYHIYTPFLIYMTYMISKVLHTHTHSPHYMSQTYQSNCKSKELTKFACFLSLLGGGWLAQCGDVDVVRCLICIICVQYMALYTHVRWLMMRFQNVYTRDEGCSIIIRTAHSSRLTLTGTTLGAIPTHTHRYYATYNNIKQKVVNAYSHLVFVEFMVDIFNERDPSICMYPHPLPSPAITPHTRACIVYGRFYLYAYTEAASIHIRQDYLQVYDSHFIIFIS